MKTVAIALISSLALFGSAYADSMTYTQVNSPNITCSDTKNSHICSMVAGTNLLPTVNENVGSYDTTQHILDMQWNPKVPNINVKFSSDVGEKQECVYTNTQTNDIHVVPVSQCDQPDNTPYTIFMLYDIKLQKISAMNDIIAHSLKVTINTDILFTKGSAVVKEENADFSANDD